MSANINSIGILKTMEGMRMIKKLIYTVICCLIGISIYVSAAHAAPNIDIARSKDRITIKEGVTDEILAQAKEAVGDGEGVRFSLDRMSAEDIAKICEAFPTMSGLDIGMAMDLTSIAFVAKLTNLTRFEMSAPVADFSPLSDLTGLNTLKINASYTGQGMLAPDLKWMSKLTNLTELFIAGPIGVKTHTFVSLEGIPHLPNLTEARFQRVVADLTPLRQALPGVKKLFLEFSIIENLTPLTGLPALEELILYGSTVKDFSPLAGAPALKTLSVGTVTESDFSTLGKLTQVENLKIGSEELEDIAWISGMTGLKNFEVTFAAIANYSPLATVRLESMFFWRSRVPVDLKQLSGATSLKKLTLQDIKNTSGFEGLASLVNLEELSLQRMLAENSGAVDLAFIASLVNLKKLTISAADITGGFDGVANCVNLEEVEISRATGIENFGALMALPNLARLEIPKGTFTEEQLKGFANPEIKVSQR